MYHTKNCYQQCIEKDFILHEKLWQQAEVILTEMQIKARIGRPSLDLKRGLNGIYYLLKTGIIWRAIPRCFGSSSAIHRLFQKLVKLGFFKKIWINELATYDAKHGLDLRNQATDCSHVKSPLGREKTGKSPVDRRKLGCKRSITTEKKGIVIGCAIGPSNQPDYQLFAETIQSIPANYRISNATMHLDAGYDFPVIHDALFNFGYVPKVVKNPRRNKKIGEKIPDGYERWYVERSHSWLNKFRRLYIRYEKYAINYLALLHFSFAIINFKKMLI